MFRSYLWKSRNEETEVSNQRIAGTDSNEQQKQQEDIQPNQATTSSVAPPPQSSQGGNIASLSEDMQQQEAHNINTSQTKGKSKKEKAKDIQPPHVRLMHKYRGSKSACTKEEQNISDPAFLYNKTHHELKHAKQIFVKKVSILSKDWAAYANSLEGNLKDLQLQRLENYMKEMSDTMDLLDQRIGEIGPKENVNLQAADSTSGGEESDNQEDENTEKTPTPERFSGFHDDQVEHLAS